MDFRMLLDARIAKEEAPLKEPFSFAGYFYFASVLPQL